MLAGSSPPFLGRERAAVDVDVGPERRSPRYHETCLALESVEESSAAVSKPRGVWLRIFSKYETHVIHEKYHVLHGFGPDHVLGHTRHVLHGCVM